MSERQHEKKYYMSCTHTHTRRNSSNSNNNTAVAVSLSVYPTMCLPTPPRAFSTAGCDDVNR